MPKTAKPVKKEPKDEPCRTNETSGYLSGLHTELYEQVHKYVELVSHLLSVQARVELQEKNLRNTREHFAAQIAKSKGAVPDDWSGTLACARFVGERLSDSCMVLLKEHRALTPQQLLTLLNNGQYRFRTHTPFREIHGALFKQAWAKRDGDNWVWDGPDPQLQLIGRVQMVERQAS
jgi:hypothetical protein